jgi:hypothetical protein
MRIYNGNDLKMLIAAKVILLNYKKYLSVLQDKNSKWNKNKIENLIRELDLTLVLYNKVSAQKQDTYLNHKFTIYKIQAIKGIKHLRNIIIHRIDNPKECDQILNQLALNKENDISGEHDTPGLIDLLLSIYNNLNPDTINKLCIYEKEKIFINRLLQYSITIPKMYYSCKSLIAVQKTMKEYAISRYNYIYSSIIEIIDLIKERNIHILQNSIDYIYFIYPSKKENILK